MNGDLVVKLQQGLGSLFVASDHRGYLRVRTPFWYPDGGVVDVFVRYHAEAGDDGGLVTLTDLGEALGWLRLQTVSGKRSPKQQRLVEDICQTQGVELWRGQLVLRCPSPATIARDVVRLGQAIVRVADLWFTTRTRSVESATDEVADLLQDREIAYERGVKLAGRSGRDWLVDFQTRTPHRSSLVFVLASGSRAAARRVSEHVLAGWHDLNLLKTGQLPLRFVSLFDDTSDVWADEDFRLVESVSDIGRLSQPDEFEALLRAA